MEAQTGLCSVQEVKNDVFNIIHLLTLSILLYISVAMSAVETMSRYVQWQRRCFQGGQANFNLSPSCLSVVNRLLGVCHMLWGLADQRERERAAEEESLYRYRPRTFEVSEREEELVMERQLKELFPSFENDFQGEGENHENDHDEQGVTDDSSKVTSACSLSQFTDDEMQLILSLHLTTFADPSDLPLLPSQDSAHHALEVVQQLLQAEAEEANVISSPALSSDHLLVGGLARMCYQLTSHVTSDTALPSNR